ncbi:hypothetical protein BCR36DRAFT_359592 [Piromyces finnis]|uniref:Anaphase-promoting complex subunit 5 n=1 Tax=Piromyces finnis TaxID=1754191 RepID=A0A1Y1V2F6_9FUNG|nr:hypothetical protein BCR36DRAFT_359592 [Piromyces finnis]|eukprot:ORX44493.1 hypothetical protein BCR36DRAFT_359592 [Piromyces finnis]
MSFDNVTPQGQPYIQFTSFSPSPSLPDSITSPYSSNQISQTYNNNINNTYNIEKSVKESVTKKVVTRYVTPHKISLLILIKEFFHEKYKDILSPILLFLIDELNNLNKFQKNELISLFQKINNLNLEYEKIELVKSTIYKKLSNIQSPDTLLNFFSEIKQLVVDKNALIDVSVEQQLYVDKTSIIGVFIRKSCLEINQMAFDDISNLFRSLLYYIQKFDSNIPEHKNKRQKMNDDQINLNIANENIEVLPLNDIQNFINRQIDLLDKCSGEIPSNELQQKLIQIHMYLPSIANVHYLSFLNCLYAKERENTLEQLYRFFDYSGMLNYNKDKTLYQYGLINLAMFHSFFNEIDMEKICLEEAVYMSKINKDYECLSYSLCWLNNLVSSNKLKPKNKQIMKYSKKRIMNSYEITNNSLLQLKCIDELRKIKYGINEGISPTTIFKSFLQSEYMSKSNSLNNMFSSCLHLKSSMWSVYGNNILANLAIQLQLNYYNDEIHQKDRHLGISKLVNQHFINGNYRFAYSLLNNAIKHSKNSNQCEKWYKSKMEFQFRRSIYKREFLNARIIHSILIALDNNENNEDEIDSFIRKGFFLYNSQQKHMAYDCISNIIDKHYKYFNNIKKFNCLLYIAEILMNSSSNVSALYNLLACLSLSESFHFHNLYIYSAARIAQVLLDINMYNKALEIMDFILPCTLTNENLWLQSLCLLIAAKCLMTKLSFGLSMSNIDDEKKEKKKKKLSDIVLLLEKSLQGFKKLESYEEMKEIVYLQSLIFNELDLIQERDQKAKEFHKLEKLILSNRNKNTVDLEN